MIAERDEALSQKSTAAKEAAPIAQSSSRKITGEVFIGGGESQGIRVKFAGITVSANPLAEAQAALNTNLAPEYPPSHRQS